jgi:hypothetical protein
MPVLNKDPGSNWYALSKKLGCGGVESGNQTVDCIRQKAFGDITKAMANGNSFMTPFTPTADEKIIFKDMAGRKKTGNFIKKVNWGFCSILLIFQLLIRVLNSAFALRQ